MRWPLAREERLSSIARAPPASVATPTAARTFFARMSFIYGQGATFPIFAVQGQNRGLGPLFRVHGGERKTPRSAGDFIHDYRDIIDRTVLGEHRPEVIIGNVKGKIVD